MKTLNARTGLRALAGTLLVASLVAGGAISHGASNEPAMIKNGVLVGPNGMTLYIFDKDSAGKSMCAGQCATNWPPFIAPEGSMAGGDYGVIKRDDGKMQFTYEGKPLYYWSKDLKPGDMTGEGMGGVWHVAK